MLTCDREPYLLAVDDRPAQLCSGEGEVHFPVMISLIPDLQQIYVPSMHHMFCTCHSWAYGGGILILKQWNIHTKVTHKMPQTNPTRTCVHKHLPPKSEVESGVKDMTILPPTHCLNFLLRAVIFVEGVHLRNAEIWR